MRSELASLGSLVGVMWREMVKMALLYGLASWCQDLTLGFFLLLWCVWGKDVEPLSNYGCSYLAECGVGWTVSFRLYDK